MRGFLTLLFVLPLPTCLIFKRIRGCFGVDNYVVLWERVLYNVNQVGESGKL